MTAAMWINDVPVPIGEIKLSLNRIDNHDSPHTLLDIRSRSYNRSLAGIAISRLNIGNVPTIQDISNQTFSLSQADSNGDLMGNSVLWKPGDDPLELQSLTVKFGMPIDGALPVEIESICADHHGNEGLKIRIEVMHVINPPATGSIANRFALARFGVARLQYAVIAITWLFGALAVISLWNASKDRAVIVALVPVALYSVISVAVYRLGMKYLRAYFAQVGISDRDWLLGEQVLVSPDNGVMLKVRFGTAYIIWEQLIGVAQDGSYYYLLIAPNQGFIVPKQAVKDPMLRIKLEDLATLTSAKVIQGS